MSELLVCFPCCLTSRPQPRPARPRIDRSMIGLPTNFRHTGHIGSGDMASGTDKISCNDSALNQNAQSTKSSTVTNAVQRGLQLPTTKRCWNSRWNFSWKSLIESQEPQVDVQII
ncbi:CDC42 small effector protein 2-A [Exaiptasia diaphana]|nr:CDC42 small effector protein 2-A [Exaiptasia diaphana]